jgi:hypothetical protein
VYPRDDQQTADLARQRVRRLVQAQQRAQAEVDRVEQLLAVARTEARLAADALADELGLAALDTGEPALRRVG